MNYHRFFEKKWKKSQQLFEMYLYENRFEIGKVDYQNGQRENSTNPESSNRFRRGHQIDLVRVHGYILL
jgi:hypothetical protein